MKNSANIRSLLLFITLAGMFHACGSASKPAGEREKALSKADKPLVDTAKVLPTLELYRAKRYESVQEALKADPAQVHKLIIYGRGIETLPDGLDQLSQLASLDVSQNKLTVLSEDVASLHYLQGFYAVGNQLTDFPEQLILLPVLQKIDLADNQIRSIPAHISRMDQLERLSLDGNAIMEVPVELYSLENLSVLELAGNGLTIIPEGIANLRKLKKLDLADNQLSTIPKEITTLGKTLTDLSIQGNQIPREEIDWLIEAMPGTSIRF